MNLVRKNTVIAILLVCFSCILPYDERLIGPQNVLFVEGFLTNLPSENYVKITESFPNGNAPPVFRPYDLTEIWITIDGAEKVTLEESRPGFYVFPVGFLGLEGKQYQLHFINSEGLEFYSTEETMPAETQIEKAYHEFNPQAVEELGVASPGHRIFIDAKDDASEVNYYQWTWRLYEQIGICKTCPESSKFSPANIPGQPGLCVTTLPYYSTPSYDYLCEGECWDIIPSRTVNTLDDKFTNGGSIIKKEVAAFPFYERSAALVDVVQMGIDKRFYEYLNIVKKQGQETGGLADTPPITLAGNIRQEGNSDLKIGGYFAVVSADVQRHWLDKLDVPDTFLPLGRLGHIPQFEPGNIVTPPLAPCLESDGRTAIKPEGWKL